MLVLKILEQMGSVILVMDFNSSSSLVMADFWHKNFRTNQLSLPCNGFYWFIWTLNGRLSLVL